MCEVIGGLVLCSGILGYAGPLDDVARRRYQAGWGVDSDPAGYDVLLGLQDCSLLGRTGHLFAGGEIYTALVADCNGRGDGWPSPYYLGDVSVEGIGRQGWVVLR